MKSYDIIYADPPWSYNNPVSNIVNMGGLPYPSMRIEDIMSLPIGSLASENSVLFLWATMPMLKKAFSVIEAWGFSYTTCAFVWVKENKVSGGIYTGMGNWTNSNAELCLLAKKGNPKRIARNVKQILVHPVGAHSRKPDEIRTRIVDLMGDLPRVELFAREKHEGWDSWGNEVDNDIILKERKFI